MQIYSLFGEAFQTLRGIPKKRHKTKPKIRGESKTTVEYCIRHKTIMRLDVNDMQF